MSGLAGRTISFLTIGGKSGDVSSMTFGRCGMMIGSVLMRLRILSSFCFRIVAFVS